MRLALFQPDMPQNTGTMLRLGACVGVEVDVIEPCGFVLASMRCVATEWIIWSWLNIVVIIRGKIFCNMQNLTLMSTDESCC